MNEKLLGEWGAAQKVNPQILNVLKESLAKLGDEKADQLIMKFSSQNMTMMQAVAEIKGIAMPAKATVAKEQPQGGDPKTVVKDSGQPEGQSKASPDKGGKKPGFSLPFGKAKPAPSQQLKAGSKKKPGKQMLIVGAVLVIVILAAVLVVPKFLNGSNSNDPYTPAPEQTEVVPGGGEGGQTVPDQGLTNMGAEDKKAWAGSVVDSVVTEDFLNKPASIADFLQNFPWNWVLYLLGVPMMLFMVYRERSSAREFSDIKLATAGIVVMLLAVLVAGPIAKTAAESGWPEMGVVYVVLTVGFLLNLAFQGGAVITGMKDYSVLAMGIYSSGLLLRWWFPADKTLSMLGMLLMVVGMVIQLVEIRRGGAATRSLIGTVLMTVFFAAAFVGVFVLIQDKIAGFVIPADAAEQAKAAVWVAFLTKSQITLSVLGGLGIAMVVGMIYGALFLQPKAPKNGGGRVGDGAVDLRNLNFLESDSQGLFVQILFFALPWIWILPQIAKLFL